MNFIFFITISYLIGSIPNGLILSKIFLNKDPRDIGSGNIGATNVARAGGIYIGILTLLLDILKGALPVYITSNMNISEQLPLFSGLAAFLGHLFPIYLKFKGGKGVATAIGVFLALTPVAILVASFVFFIIAFTFKYISLASIISAIFLPGIIKLLLLLNIYQYDNSIIYLSTIISLLIIYRHKDNIVRLINKKEPKFGTNKTIRK